MIFILKMIEKLEPFLIFENQRLDLTGLIWNPELNTAFAPKAPTLPFLSRTTIAAN
jgi:hypothetical protein